MVKKSHGRVKHIHGHVKYFTLPCFYLSLPSLLCTEFGSIYFTLPWLCLTLQSLQLTYLDFLYTRVYSPLPYSRRAVPVGLYSRKESSFRIWQSHCRAGLGVVWSIIKSCRVIVEWVDYKARVKQSHCKIGCLPHTIYIGSLPGFTGLFNMILLSIFCVHRRG